MANWERFDEVFDSSDGGCLYLAHAENERSANVVLAAGASWLDGGQDGLHYWAGVAQFYLGEERYGDTDVMEFYDAAEAFNECIDSEIGLDLGWFETLDEAVQAVEDYVENDE